MPIEHAKEYRVYHWDTFDNEPILIAEAEDLLLATEIVHDKYKGRITSNGADQVDIVNSKGDIVKKFKVK